MKPLDVVLSFPECHKRGGVERIMYECSYFLAKRNHNVMMLANKVDESLLEWPNVSLENTAVSDSVWFLNGLRYYLAASKEMRRLEYDVLNSHGCVSPTGGIPWVQSVHKAWLEVSRTLRSNHRQRIRQRLNPLHPIILMLEREHFAKRNYKKVIVTTSDVRSDLNRLYGVPVSDVEIVPNGFNPQEFNVSRRFEARSSTRLSLGISDNEFVLLFVANELERKGFYTLLRALDNLRSEGVVAMVVGRYNLEEARNAVASLRLEEQVLLCSSTKDIGSYHAAADAFVLPTKYEAFCLAILEALGSGLPVVTTRVSGAHNAIVEGVNGYLIDSPDDYSGLANIVRMLKGSNFGKDECNVIGKTVEQYHWPKVLLEYERILLENVRLR